MLTKGDKLVATKKTMFFNVGDIIEVESVEEDGIAFKWGKDFNNIGFIDYITYKNHFEKVEEKEEFEYRYFFPPYPEYIEDIMASSEISIETVYDKCAIVTCKLPNGFVIVETSGCVEARNYDEDTEVCYCLEKIEDKVWELESYRHQANLYEYMKQEECPYGYENCDECPCEEEYTEDYKCEECDDTECFYNPNPYDIKH